MTPNDGILTLLGELRVQVAQQAELIARLQAELERLQAERPPQ